LQVLEAPLEKKAGINYGPPGTKHLVYFVDDLNMPKLDPYETAMPISLIRQHLSWGHCFGKVTSPNHVHATTTLLNHGSKQMASCYGLLVLPTAPSHLGQGFPCNVQCSHLVVGTLFPVFHNSQYADRLHCAGCADRHKLTPKNINNTQYVACMNPTAGSFVVNPRLQRLFMTLAVDFPGQDSLMTIYGTFLQVCMSVGQLAATTRGPSGASKWLHLHMTKPLVPSCFRACTCHLAAALNTCRPHSAETSDNFSRVKHVHAQYKLVSNPLLATYLPLFPHQGHLKKFKEDIQELGNKILQAGLALHERVSSTFRKTAVNFHYEVSAYQIMGVCWGVLPLSCFCCQQLELVKPTLLSHTPLHQAHHQQSLVALPSLLPIVD
jgi:hypothetical protein